MPVQSRVIADVAPATNISIATLVVQAVAVNAKIIIVSMLLFYAPKQKRTSNQRLFFQFDFIVVFSSAFSVISTTVKVIMNPPMKNILSILSPPNAKKSQPTQNRLGKI